VLPIIQYDLGLRLPSAGIWAPHATKAICLDKCSTRLGSGGTEADGSIPSTASSKSKREREDLYASNFRISKYLLRRKKNRSDTKQCFTRKNHAARQNEYPVLLM